MVLVNRFSNTGHYYKCLRFQLCNPKTLLYMWFCKCKMVSYWETSICGLTVEPSNLQKALTSQNCHRTVGKLSSYSLLFGSYSRRRRQNMGKNLRRWRFLHDGTLALGSKVSSVNCTASLPRWRFLLFGSCFCSGVALLSFVLQHTNNHSQPYIDSTTVLPDITNYLISPNSLYRNRVFPVILVAT